jgi:hypothetical protein
LRRSVAPVIGVLVAAFGGAEPAYAAVSLVFKPLSAPPGVTVRGFVENAPFPARVFLTSNLQASIPTDRVEVGGGDGVLLEVPGSSPIRVSFVPLLIAPDLESGEGLPLVLVGELRPDGKGNGSLTFTVPDLPPGPYASLVYYEETDAAPGQFIAGQVFRIEPRPAKDQPALAAILGASIGGFLLVTGLVFIFLRKRRRFCH